MGLRSKIKRAIIRHELKSAAGTKQWPEKPHLNNNTNSATESESNFVESEASNSRSSLIGRILQAANRRFGKRNQSGSNGSPDCGDSGTSHGDSTSTENETKRSHLHVRFSDTVSTSPDSKSTSIATPLLHCCARNNEDLAEKPPHSIKIARRPVGSPPFSKRNPQRHEAHYKSDDAADIAVPSAHGPNHQEHIEPDHSPEFPVKGTQFKVAVPSRLSSMDIEKFLARRRRRNARRLIFSESYSSARRSHVQDANLLYDSRKDYIQSHTYSTARRSVHMELISPRESTKKEALETREYISKIKARRASMMEDIFPGHSTRGPMASSIAGYQRNKRNSTIPTTRRAYLATRASIDQTSRPASLYSLPLIGMETRDPSYSPTYSEFPIIPGSFGVITVAKTVLLNEHLQFRLLDTDFAICKPTREALVGLLRTGPPRLDMRPAQGKGVKTEHILGGLVHAKRMRLALIRDLNKMLNEGEQVQCKRASFNWWDQCRKTIEVFERDIKELDTSYTFHTFDAQDTEVAKGIRDALTAAWDAYEKDREV
ncbi:hypothetical protein CDD82_1440 [Ophiocordyceps australis]|uniref:Uncharacterized protein n=1 Tax=Ophiocordyceps australis TaxID=1399860 RepID=A0A2C5ZLN5_9HYPO|nr:hypothetical protein CDD82_1440 [Ophiocordyceps australis]